MKGCEDVKMRSLDVKVCKCEMRRYEEAEKRCEDVKIPGCEDDEMTRVDVKMYGCEDRKNRKMRK